MGILNVTLILSRTEGIITRSQPPLKERWL